MADEIRVSRPMSGNGQPMMAGDMREYAPRGGSRTPWIILAVIVIVLVIVGVLFRDKLMGSQTGSTVTKGSGYQAVFLTNGQVYFGKLSGESGDYATLKDIYYLQVTQPPLQGSQTGTTGAAAQPQAQPQLSLVKLGNELHGPVDSMQINRDQILFFEDMKDDGKVMQAIREYQKNPPANTQNTQPAPTTPTTPTTPNQ
jgi:hypothetical protein